jgi:hypothetical protein
LQQHNDLKKSPTISASLKARDEGQKRSTASSEALTTSVSSSTRDRPS